MCSEWATEDSVCSSHAIRVRRFDLGLVGRGPYGAKMEGRFLKVAEP